MFKSNLIKTFAITAFTLLAFSHAHAQTKVGFVSTERILKESVPAQAATKTLVAEFASRENALGELANDIKKRGEKLERDGSTMSAGERNRLQGEIADQDAKFQRERRNLEEEIQGRRSQLLSGILERANREVIRVAELEKIDIVLQDAVWASPKIDITARVIDALK